MGNYKFKLSNMMPNAWFYRLKDMSRAKKNSKSSNKKPYISQPRRSTYHDKEPTKPYKFCNSPTNPKFSDTHFPDFARKSLKRKTIYKPSPRLSTSSISYWGNLDYLFSSSESSDNEFYESRVTERESNSIEDQEFFNELSSWSSSCSCRVTSSTTDIFIDVNEKTSFCKKFEDLNGSQLRPIVTKREKFGKEDPKVRKLSRQEQSTLSFKIVKEGPIKTQHQRKSVTNSTGLKLKSNSPKIVSKRMRTRARKNVSLSKESYTGSRKNSFSKSFAIIKSSLDPLRDFRDSMAEMIVVNGLNDSKDLEELLACYLLLNLEEYHGVIVKAFEQIWFEMASLRL